ncbi:formate/nitrite transporter family protein [Vibrio metschnikovii]
MFVSSGFEHCIASMYQVPLAIGIKYVALRLLADDWGEYRPVCRLNHDELFIVDNSIPVTLGSIVGVVCLRSWYWLIYLKE